MITMYDSRELSLFCFLLCVVVGSSQAHLCLITPRQRGAMDISKGGDHTCFRHGAECGGELAQVPPEIVLDGGRPLFIKWQQNYNHYNFGFPGYMDLAFAENKSTAEGYKLSPFTMLTVVPDPNEYDQANQRNYTAVVTLPNYDCDHCIIRARYNAHKPGETTFYQCADIKVRATEHAHLKLKHGGLQLFDTIDIVPSASGVEESDTSRAGKEKLRRALVLVTPSAPQVLSAATNRDVEGSAPTIRGLANHLDAPQKSSYLTVDPVTGEKSEVGQLNLRVDSSFERYRLTESKVSNDTVAFVPDGVFSVDPSRGVTAMPFNPNGARESFPGSMVEIQTTTGKIVNHYQIEELNKTTIRSSFSAVLVDKDHSFITFGIEPASQQGKYDFVVGRLNTSGVWQMLLRSNQPEDLYINFQWAEFDVDTQTLYALLGNENDAEGLSARIYKFSLPQGIYGPKMSVVDLDVSEFTFMSFHINKQNANHLWAISPGLHSAEYPAYYLVDIETNFGSVWKVAQLTPPGIFERYYGGTVATGGPGVTNHQVMHVLRVADTQADVIVTVDTLQAKTSFSQVTNLRGLHNLVYA